MSDEKLNEIKAILEDIRASIILSNQDNIDKAKEKLLKPNSVEETVYKLCDGTNTSSDIATKIQKSAEYTGAVVSTLRQKGLVRTVEKNGKKVHEQRF